MGQSEMNYSHFFFKKAVFYSCKGFKYNVEFLYLSLLRGI